MEKAFLEFLEDLGFNVSVTPLMDGIIMLHNHVMFYLIVISVAVFLFLFRFALLI